VKAARAIIAEDEPLLRNEIRDTLQNLWPELTICAEVADGHEALDAMERWSPDVIFLDIHMPSVDGLAVAERVSRKAHVVFITAYDEHTLAAFEQGALDYVLKPISAARLKVTVNRLQARLQTAPPDLKGLMDLINEVRGSQQPRYMQWLTVPHGSQFKLVTAGEIRYLRADNKYTILYTATGEFLLTATLKEVREKLDPALFWQIHRSIVVNVSAIDTVYRAFRGSLEVKLKDRPEMLPVSAAHTHLFKKL
jgi:DNA-binding LytR/AlgR family response regulator